MHSDQTIFFWAFGSGWVLSVLWRKFAPTLSEVLAELRQGLDR
jgi:hypothetical protein